MAKNENKTVSPVVTAFFDEATFTASYVLACPNTGAAAVIDSVLDYSQASGRTSHESADKIIDHVRTQGLTVHYHIETHVHADHLSAAPYLKAALGGETVIGTDIAAVQDVFADVFDAEPAFARDGSQFDRLVRDGETLKLGGLTLEALHTPGHTPACMSYLVGDAVFVGDTIFMPDYGSARCDFPGGDARQLYRSVQRLFALPDETRMFLCHDYKAPGRDQFVWQTTVGQQKADNIHLGHGTGEEDFVQMRSARDKTLSTPNLMLPSVQVNMRAGDMPPVSDNGTTYLKIPLNRI